MKALKQAAAKLANHSNGNIIRNGVMQQRKNSSANPLYTPAEDDVIDGNYNSVFVTMDNSINSSNSLPANPRVRQNSVYDVTNSTPVRLPSGSSDTSDEFAAILMTSNKQNGRFTNGGTLLQHGMPYRQARKGSVPTVKSKNKNKRQGKRLSSSLPGREKHRRGSSKKIGNLAPIRETKHSKRFTRQISNNSMNGNGTAVPNGNIQNGDISHEYIRPIFLTDGTTHSPTQTEMDNVRAHLDRRNSKTPSYSVT